MVKKKILFTLIISTLLLTACSSFPDLSEDDEYLVAEYGAGVVTNFYKEQKGLKPVTSEETTVAEEQATATESASQSPSVSGGGEVIPPVSTTDTTQEASEASTNGDENYFASDNLNTNNSTSLIENVLEITGVEVSILGYSVEDTYPTEAFAFAVNADKGKQLVVVEYDVWNSEDADAVMTLKSQNVTIKGVINGSKEVNASRTLLSNDIMNMNNSKFAPGEAKVGVVIFQVDEETAKSITSVEVKATKN